MTRLKQILGLTLTTLLSLPAAASSDAQEVAKELANPNTSLASLNFKLQSFSGYQDGRETGTTLFQPSMPFNLENGDKVLFRPAIPLLTSRDGQTGDTTRGIGDISFDLAYAPSLSGGNLVAFGMFAQLPTGQDGYSSEQLAMGPEMLIGKITSNSVLGAFPNHLWSVSNSGDQPDINRTSAQLFAIRMLGNGWAIGTSPTLSYDWTSDQAEIPLNLNVSKTTVLGGRPWKFGIEANYYLEKDERTRPDFMLGINITPVVTNKLAEWL